MIVLDTNVVSELMRASPAHEVVEWLDTQQTRDLFVTSVTEAEIRAGMAVLPEGARRRGLVAAVGGGVSGETEALARVKIDALLKNAGWNLTDGSSVVFEYALPDGTQADYVLCDRQGRPMAALEAKPASVDPVTTRERPGQFLSVNSWRADLVQEFTRLAR